MSNIHEMAFLQQKVQELKEQGLYKVPVTLDGPNEAECVINGKKVIKADNGKKYRCLELSYLEQEEKKNKEIIRFFVTDDSNHVPIRLDMFLKFGSAKAFLVGMKGIKNAITSEVQ